MFIVALIDAKYFKHDIVNQPPQPAPVAAEQIHIS